MRLIRNGMTGEKFCENCSSQVKLDEEDIDLNDDLSRTWTCPVCAHMNCVTAFTLGEE